MSYLGVNQALYEQYMDSGKITHTLYNDTCLRCGSWKPPPRCHINTARMASSDSIYKEEGGCIYHLYFRLLWPAIPVNPDVTFQFYWSEATTNLVCWKL